MKPYNETEDNLIKFYANDLMCSQQEIAKYLGRTRGSVSARIHRLRKEGVYIRPFKESVSNQEEAFEAKYHVEKQFLYFLLILLFLYVLITY